MRNIIIVAIAALLVAAWFFTQSGNTPPDQSSRTQSPSVIVPELTADAKIGETFFNAKCASCHGVNGTGTDKGPPFLHKFYEPNHHGDEAFQRAAKVGVQAHHWNFGNMPPVAGVTRAEVSKIIIYIRTIQAANGI